MSDLVPELITASSLEAITRAESTTAVDIANRYPRTISKFKQSALELATIDQHTAEQCFFFLPRAGGIYGPSVRLAEIIASTWGNIQVASRIVEIGETHVTAQGVAWDLERNNRMTSEAKRSITNKKGQRYNADMINVTCNAACSIARRNAVFAVVPKAYWNAIYEQCRTVAVGDQRTIVEQVQRLMDWAGKLGVSDERLLAAVGVEDASDIGLGHLKQLRGMATAIKDNELSIEEAFPEPKILEVVTEGKKTTTKKKGRSTSPKKGGKSKGDKAAKDAENALPQPPPVGIVEDMTLKEEGISPADEPAAEDEWADVGPPPMGEEDPE